MRPLLYYWRRLKQIGAGSRYGYCFRCGRSWGEVNPHHTWFGKKLPQTKGTFGVFPLCEPCWTVLAPEQRLPFYRALFRLWKKQWPATEVAQWELIEDAVRRGQ